jgi:hypothetical protein
MRTRLPVKIFQALRDSPRENRQTIWDTFWRTLTNDPNPAVRAKAATALALAWATARIGKLYDPKFSPTLLTALTDSIPDLIVFLQDPDLNVATARIEALGNAAA